MMSGALQAVPPDRPWVGGRGTLRQAGHRIGALGPCLA
jgi:hypothetical protein